MFCAAVTAMDLSYLNPYLDSVGAPSFQTGCNFATGGATILPANAASRNPFSFGIQVAQFLRFKARVLELLASKGTNVVHGCIICLVYHVELTDEKFGVGFRQDASTSPPL